MEEHRCLAHLPALAHLTALATQSDPREKYMFIVFNNLSFKEIEMELEKAAGQVDHSESDCIFIAVLSHGELGILYASDHAYKPDRLWTAFNAEK